MKYLLLLSVILSPLFINHPVEAQRVTSPTFFCVGTNPQAPCATVVPSHVVSISPAVSLSTPTITVNPSTVATQMPSTTSPLPTTPCLTTQAQNIHAFGVN